MGNYKKRLKLSFIINLLMVILFISSIINEIVDINNNNSTYINVWSFFRYFTIDGNLLSFIFNSIITFKQFQALRMQNEKEMKEKTISHFLYMISLISSCNEIIILIVVIIIFLPFADSIIIKSLLGSYKVANLHLTIPILLNFRFLFLDKRKRQLKIYEKFYGGIPMCIYGIIMFILCLAKVFTSYDKDNGDGKIPYPFFDLYHQSWYISFFIILLIFIFGFGIGFLFDFLNKKLEKLIFPYDSSSEDDEQDKKILLISLIDMKETFKDI